MINSMKGVLMKRLARNIVLALLILSLSSITEAGPKPKEKGGPPSWAPAHGARAKHRYRYFPDHRIYFDIDRKLYFFLEGSIWKSAPKPPLLPGLPPIPKIPHPGDFIDLELDTPKPYIYYDEHKVKYPGKKNKVKKKKKKGKWK